MVEESEHQEPLALKVLGLIREHRLVSGRRWLVVAVSGGQDSVCLLHILVKLQKELKVKLHVAHLNHQLRGAESEADAQYVSGLAGQLGIPATIGQRDVKAYQARHRVSLEEAAREVRYAFLAEVAESIGADRIAVGHTSDDHVETILMHLIRGSGTRGLRGLPPSSRWPFTGTGLTVIRPLLPVSRAETVGYCRRYQLEPRIDATNRSLSPLRNRIRLKLRPLLESYNPRVAEALLRTARIATDDFALLNKEVTRMWGKVAWRQGKTVILDKKRLLNLPPAGQRYLLQMAIEELLGSLKDIEMRHIEGIMAALTKPVGKRLHLPGSLVFTIEYNQYLIGPEAAALSPFPTLEKELTLEIPGETRLSGWQVAATILSSSVVKGGPNEGTALWDAVGKDSAGDNFTAYLDFDRVGNNVLVRGYQPGDRFQPLGMSQPKKLGEFMIDAKIPRTWRQRVPIVCSPRHILWVVGWRIDDRVKVTESTQQVLCLRFSRIAGA